MRITRALHAAPREPSRQALVVDDATYMCSPTLAPSPAKTRGHLSDGNDAHAGMSAFGFAAAFGPVDQHYLPGAREMQALSFSAHIVWQRRRVSGGEHEPVSIRPDRVGRVEAQEPLTPRVSDGGIPIEVPG